MRHRRGSVAPKTEVLRPAAAAFRLAGIYFLVGMVWILFSDRALAVCVQNSSTYAWFQTWKGFFYVIVTSVVFAMAAHRELLREAKLSKRLADSSAEQESLIRELHHRVKNNLQLASSLASLRIPRIENDETKAIFVEYLARLKTIALVQDKVYATGCLAIVNLGDYCSEAIAEYRGLYGRHDLSFRGPGNAILVPVDRAVPFALLLDEVVSNAAVHAFGSDGAGSIVVEFSFDGASAFLSVRDDGVGFDPSEVLDDSLGLKLIGGLCEQLGGSYGYRFEGGTIFELRFPASQSGLSLPAEKT